ncbi:hypothetical protein CRYUN_Cryun32bG0067200 [Craigia yunnanensis]
MEKTEKIQLPHNYEAILKDAADSPVYMSSMDKMLSQLHAGVFLNQKRKLEVHGKFDVAKLSPGTLYGVVFIVTLRDKAYGLEVPLNFGLTLPNRQKGMEGRTC